MDTREARQLLAELAQVIAELTMMSHVSAVNLNPSAPSSDEAIGGRRPSGGIDRKDDRDKDIAIKSADHFTARARKCRTTRDIEAVLADARTALEAWKRTPPQTGTEPEYGTLHWKRWIASHPAANAELARRFNVSAQYIGQVRRQYGKDSAAA